MNGHLYLVNVLIEKWMNISSSNAIALICCGAGLGMYALFVPETCPENSD